MNSATQKPRVSSTAGETALLEAVRREALTQDTIHTATRLPLERLAVAPRIERAPQSPDDPVWNEAADVGSFFLERLEDGFDASTRAAIAHDGANLYVRFECKGAPGRTTFAKNWYHADTVELFLDPTHDHRRYLQLAITAGGHCAGSENTRPLDSMRWEHKQTSTALKDGTWRGQSAASDDGWRAQFSVPFALLGRNEGSAQTLGINFFHHTCGGEWTHAIWNATYAGPHAPWAFGQLALDEAPAAHVEQVDLGEIRLWDNRGTLYVRNLSGSPLDAKLSVRIDNGEKEEEDFHRSERAVMLGAGSECQRVAFEFPFNPEDYRWQHLHLELAGANGEPIWNATYRFGRGQGWLLQIDDRREGPEVSNPDADDPDFMRKKRLYIIRRLPRFARKTTAQGAPSDFTLEAEDGSVLFDLMQPGALQRIADYIYSRYENDTDRLLGANFFVHQPAVMTYANSPTTLAGALSPLSILRLGAAQCCCFAAALAGVIEKMRCEETGKPYRATRVGVPGHVTTVVEFRGKRVHLDPSVGRFYYLRDNRTLASMEDLLADPALASRAGRHLEAFHKKASEDADAPTFYRPERGVWPQGAPAE